MTKWLHDLQTVSFDLESNNNIEHKEIKNNSIELKINSNYVNQNKLAIINKLDNKIINEKTNNKNQDDNQSKKENTSKNDEIRN